MELVTCHWLDKHGRVVQGINQITLLGTEGDRYVPLDYRFYKQSVDTTKNHHFLHLQNLYDTRYRRKTQELGTTWLDRIVRPCAIRSLEEMLRYKGSIVTALAQLLGCSCSLMIHTAIQQRPIFEHASLPRLKTTQENLRHSCLVNSLTFACKLKNFSFALM